MQSSNLPLSLLMLPQPTCNANRNHKQPRCHRDPSLKCSKAIKPTWSLTWCNPACQWIEPRNFTNFIPNTSSALQLGFENNSTSKSTCCHCEGPRWVYSTSRQNTMSSRQKSITLLNSSSSKSDTLFCMMELSLYISFSFFNFFNLFRLHLPLCPWR